MITETTISTSEKEQTMGPICGFWRRLGALAVDSVILGLIGMLLGGLFGEQLAKLGKLGPLIGFAISVFYFGFFNSVIGGGQTVGKRVFNIRVLNKDGSLLSIEKAFFRAILLSLAIIGLPMSLPMGVMYGIIIGLLLAVSLGLPYFYLFNRKTRQSIHDILCGTYVGKADALKTPMALTINPKHYVAYGVIVLVAGGLLLQTHTRSDVQAMSALQREIMQIDGVYGASVKLNSLTQLQKGVKVNNLTVTVRMQKKPTPDEKLRNEVAKVILEKYQGLQNVQIININVIYGYHIGIASGFQNFGSSGTPQNWKDKLQMK